MIRLRNLAAGYGRKQILSPASLSISGGECIALVGPNGSGKSTLLKTIADQIKPQSGEVHLNDKPLSAYSHKERAMRIAYFPQSRPIPHMDVQTLVSHGRFPHLDFGRKMQRGDKALVDKAMKQTNLCALRERQLFSLSGGERQRAYLAMMIAQDADILLLDEPATFLDIYHQIEVLELLSVLNKCGKTVVFATHDLPSAFSYAQRVMIMKNGAIISDDTPDNLAESHVLIDVFGVSLRKCEEDFPFSYRLVGKR